MNKENLILELKTINLELSTKQLKQIDDFCEFLINENKKTNLTAITELESIYLKHIYDSLTITKIINLNNYQTLLDIGCGAGFPGIILKIVFPDLKITLLDSNGKKTNFLKNAIKYLKLENIIVINQRAEEFIINHREFYDIVTARAVAPLNILAELAIPFVNINGFFIALKANLETNKESINSIANILGGFLNEIIEFDLPIENSIRNLIKIQKKQKTLNQYPRRYEQIKKNPLKIVNK